MKTLNILFLLFLIVVFFVGLYVYVFNTMPSCVRKSMNADNIEGMENNESSDKNISNCPDMLINQGDVLLLYNSNQPEKHGVNPLPFYNLDEYINYLEIQRKKGIKCPVLYLQKENSAQGKPVYRVRPGPFDQQGGLPTPEQQMTISQFNHQDKQIDNPPTLILDNNVNLDKNSPVKIMDASREQAPYNAGNYAGFDSHGLYQGTYTEIDKIHDSTAANGMSDNPLDPNWGGVLYTQQMVDSGKYDENTITKPIYANVKNVAFIPGQFGHPSPPNEFPAPEKE
jgi:hypothetical protein